MRAGQGCVKCEDHPLSGPIRVAYASVPKEGGTFTFYRNIKAPLRNRGVEMICVAVGRDQAELWNAAYADPDCVLLAPNTAGLKRQAQVFVDWCRDEAIDIVIGVNSPAILSALPHLPADIVTVARCANGFDHGYRITLAGAERLARIIALVPRLRDDLVAGYGADPETITLVPNGIAADEFAAAAAAPRGEGRALRLGFVGRLEHNQKGVLHLPAIVEALRAKGVEVDFRIAGQGRHEDALRKALAAETARGAVTFSGLLTPPEVRDFLAETDVFVFTSHFEGCPNALLEAVTAGTVPVCWRLPGITDYVVRQGETGFLCETGDADAFAAAIATLDGDRARLKAMSAAAAADARARFSNETTAEVYAGVFREALARRGAVPPRPWSAFEVNENFRLSPVARLRGAVKRTMPAVSLLRLR